MAAPGRDPAREAGPLARLRPRLEVGVARPHVSDRLALDRARRVGVDSLRSQGVELGQAIGADLGFGVCAHGSRVKRP